MGLRETLNERQNEPDTGLLAAATTALPLLVLPQAKGVFRGK